MSRFAKDTGRAIVAALLMALFTGQAVAADRFHAAAVVLSYARVPFP